MEKIATLQRECNRHQQRIQEVEGELEGAQYVIGRLQAEVEQGMMAGDRTDLWMVADEHIYGYDEDGEAILYSTLKMDLGGLDAPVQKRQYNGQSMVDVITIEMVEEEVEYG